MIKRRRFRHTISLQDRLIAFAEQARERASHLPPGRKKQEVLRKAGQADIEAHLNGWLTSAGLRPTT